MGVKFTNNAYTTLSGTISAGATSFGVASVATFPSLGGGDYMYVSLTDEVVKVTAISGTTLTCVAVSGGHSAGITVELRMTAELLNDFAEDDESLQLAGGAMTGNITMAGSQTVDGRDLSVDGAKLDGIEASATADQTAAQIKTLLEDGIDSVHYVDGSIDAVHMSANSIDSASYVDGSIDTAHFAAGAVDAAAMGANSVDSSELVDGSVDLSHMSVNSVDSDQYVDGSIDVIHMSANSVDSDQYVDGSIDLIHMSADSVDGSKIVDDAINSEHIAADSIDAEHLAPNSVNTEAIIDDSVTSAHIAAGAVDTTALGADSVTAAKIGDDVINSEHIAATAIDLEHMSSASVDEDNLRVSNNPTNGFFLSAQSGNTGGLTWAEVDTTIANDAIDSQHYAAGSIDAEHLASDSVTEAKMAANSVDSQAYVDGSIDTAHIADLQITTGKIAADAVTGAKIADDTINSEHYAAASIDNEHLADDAVGIAELSATGTASSTTFLRGDNSWASAGGAGSAFAAYKPSGQSFGGSSWTKVTFTTEEFDTKGEYASSRFTPTVAGYYQINAQFEMNSAYSTFHINIYKNGSRFASGGTRINSGTNSNDYAKLNQLVHANGSGDYFEIYGYHNIGGSRTIGSGRITSFFQGFFVRGA